MTALVMPDPACVWFVWVAGLTVVGVVLLAYAIIILMVIMMSKC